MAGPWYVDSTTVGGTGAGTSWTNAALSLSALMALGTKPVAGDTIFFGSTSAESYGVVTTITLPGTLAAPNYLYSVTNLGGSNVPTAANLVAGASITSTPTGNALILNGAFYAYGLTFNIGSGAVTSTMVTGSTTGPVRFDTCTFNINGTTGGSFTTNNSGTTDVEWWNCNYSIAFASPIGLRGRFIWKGGAVNASAVNSNLPTVLVGSSSGVGEVRIEGVDLSALSGKNIFTAAGQTFLKDCKMPAAWTLQTGGATMQNEAWSTRADNSGSVNRFDGTQFWGTETIESSITRVGGATDFLGNGWTKKIVGTAANRFTQPFTAELMCPVNTLVTPSTRTVTVYGIFQSGTLGVPPAIDDIWIEVSYPGDSGSPKSSFVNSTKQFPSSASTGGTLDTSTWNNAATVGNKATPFSMSVPLVAQLAGPLTVKVKAAKSATFYIDPKPVLS